MPGKSKWRTYSIRALLLLMAGIGILPGWHMNRVNTQQRVVRDLFAVGANVYSISTDEMVVICDYPEWVPSSLQFVSFSNKNFVVLQCENQGDFGDEEVFLAAQLPNLRGLEINWASISDDSLERLQHCSTLIDLSLYDTTGYSEQALQRFQSALPGCQISR